MNILENFIKEKWNLLDENSKLSLRNFLVTLLIRYVTDNNFYSNPQNTFVINKLNILIVIIAKNEWTTTWPNFISELCNSSKSDPNLCENNMKLLILLSEEINVFWKNSLTAKKAFELREKMKKEFVEVFELCQLIINNSNQVKQSLLIQSIKLFAEYMNWFPINLTLNQDIMRKTLTNFKELSFCRTETMKCLGNLFGIKINISMFNGNANDIRTCRQLLMQMYQTFIQIMDVEVVKGKNFAEQYKIIFNNNPEKLSGYERMTLSFENALINFFKSNISYIQEYDFVEGTSLVSPFLENFIPQITSGLNYLAQFLLIENEEIFKAAVDFWLWFSYKVFTLKDPNDTLVYLTFIDPYKTQSLLKAKINEQSEIAKQKNKINPPLLNSISWSAGCISGAMNDSMEVDFLIVFIKVLLGLCETIKGKGNKAICASNIMYIVGQYPKFLNNHWKFLKTVVRKLFEFMHESFEGVQDFACETFLKISMKCAHNFVIKQVDENEEYIKELVRNVSENSKDLLPHQQLMFYEALGNMINVEPNLQKKIFYIKQLMSDRNSQWNKIFMEAQQNNEILNNANVVKGLSLIIHLNERVSFSTKTPYWSYGCTIFDNLIKSFIYYSDCINQQFNNKKSIDVNTRSYISYNKTVIKFLTSLVNNTDDVQIIQNEMLKSFGTLIQTYNNNHINNKDPNLLLLFSSVLVKLKNNSPDVVTTIWNYLCVSTLQLIKDDFQSFPEHRMNFFILLKSLISNSFESLFRAQNLSFNKDVIDTITFAINHRNPQMSETGLETLLTLLQKVITVGVIDLQNIVDPFFSNYFSIIFNDVFNTMTDGFHQNGFKLQVKVIQLMIRIIDEKKISEGLFMQGENNKTFFLKKLLNDILQSFKNITQVQGETFCLAMFNSCNDEHKFKTVMRDFLVSLKSFIGNNEALWEEERKKELELAKQLEQQKRAFLPGPQYDQQINADNYQNNNL